MIYHIYFLCFIWFSRHFNTTKIHIGIYYYIRIKVPRGDISYTFSVFDALA